LAFSTTTFDGAAPQVVASEKVAVLNRAHGDRQAADEKSSTQPHSRDTGIEG